MFRTLFIISLIFLSLNLNAKDHYNKDAGFRYWHPGSWQSVDKGRSAFLSGSEFDQYKSEIFIGDNWDFSVVDMESLKKLLDKTYGAEKKIQKVGFSTLRGFLVGTETEGEYYLYRENNNYIYIRFSLKGIGYQLEQAQAVLNAITIRNDPIEN